MFEQFDNKENPFKVPDHFFEDFKANLPSKLPEKKKAKKLLIVRSTIFRWVSAAIFIGIIILAVDKIHFSQKAKINDLPIAEQTSSKMIDTVNDDDLYSYIQDQSTETMYDEVIESMN